MAKSTYISSHLTQGQIALLQFLDDYEIQYFSLAQLQRQYKSNIANINELAENLCQKVFLNRIERGVYAKHTFNNIEALALFISKNSTIAYWSALHYYGLTERFANTLFVKTTYRKRATTILGTSIKFVTVSNKKSIGTITQGFGSDQIEITNIEMTLVDCFDQPRYAGDFENLIKAFAKATLRAEKLITYAKAFNNIALTKRLGYLASLFQPTKLNSFIIYAQKQVNAKYSLIDAGGFEEGEFNAVWKLRLNVPEEAIIKMAEDNY